MSKKLILAACAAALSLPAAAQAASVTYVDGGNVVVASPDGSIQRQITDDGGFHLPSADDAGNVVAIKGAGSSQAIVHIAPSGQRTVNVLPMKTSTWGNFGPTGARVKPSTGSQLAYSYLWNHGPYNGGVEPRLAIVPPTAPGSPTSPMVDQPTHSMPTWFNDRLIVSNGSVIRVETQPLQFQDLLWSTEVSFNRGEMNRAGTRIAAATTDDRLVLWGWQGAVPGGAPYGGCLLPVQGDLDRAWGLSPDGGQVTWADDAGVHVGTFSPTGNPGAVCAGDVMTLSGTGIEPAFGNASLQPDPEPEPEPEPAPQPQPSPAQPRPVPTITTSGPTGQSAQSGPVAPSANTPSLPIAGPSGAPVGTLARGLVVRVTTPAAGSLSAKLVAKGKTIATGRGTARGAGGVQVKLRATKAGTKALKRLKGKRVSLRVTFTPQGGAPVTTTASVKLI